MPACSSQTQPLQCNSCHAATISIAHHRIHTYWHICAYVQVPVRHTSRREYRYDLFQSMILPFLVRVFSKAERLRTLGTSQGPYLAVQTHGHAWPARTRRVRMPHARITFYAEPTPKRQFVLKYWSSCTHPVKPEPATCYVAEASLQVASLNPDSVVSTRPMPCSSLWAPPSHPESAFNLEPRGPSDREFGCSDSRAALAPVSVYTERHLGLGTLGHHNLNPSTQA